MRRFQPVLVLSILALAAALVYGVTQRIARESPNYSQIEDGVWMGGSVMAPPPGTQAVLNLCEIEDPYQVEFHKWSPIRDAAPAPSLDWLREQVEFIEAQRRAQRTVYVHCKAGISRGGMVAAAYFMKREGWSREQTLEFLRSHRPGVRPNPAFMKLLEEWERSIKG